MPSLKIRSLLPLLFFSLFFMVILLGGIAITSLSSINKQARLLGETQAQATSAVVRIKESLAGINSLYARHLLAISLDDLKILENDLQKRTDDVHNLVDEFAAMDAAKGEAEALNSLKQSMEAFLDGGRQFISISTIGAKTIALDLYNGAMKANLEQSDATLNAMIGRNKEASAAALANASHSYTNTLILTGSMILVSCLIALASSFIAISRVARPIAKLQDVMSQLASGKNEKAIPFQERRDEIGDMSRAVEVFRENAIERIRLEGETEMNRNQSETERRRNEEQRAAQAAEVKAVVEAIGKGLGRLAGGDATVRINTPFGADFDQIRTDFNLAVGKLDDALTIIRRNAEVINSGSEEIRGAVDHLSHRTEQQAASVEETAAALEEINSTMRDSSKRAEEAGVLVESTKQGAAHSSGIVRKAVDAMSAIEQSSNQISSILGLINDIAFQTNLLALNAGVEAARAGDAGKGFAVVAQEVRELAQRSASAARDIENLIKTSQDHVQTGVGLVGDAGGALEKIAEQVVEISQHVAAIVDASREQSVGIREISTAVNTIDQGTQENAAMVEQSSAATHALAAEVESLFKLVGQFKTGSSAEKSQARSAA